MNRDKVIDEIKNTTFKMSTVSAVSLDDNGSINIFIKTRCAEAKSGVIKVGNKKIKYQDFMINTDGIMIPSWDKTTFHCREEDVHYGINEVKRKIDNNSKLELDKLKKIVSKIELLNLESINIKHIDETTNFA
jgi:hypothetical protein